MLFGATMLRLEELQQQRTLPIVVVVVVAVAYAAAVAFTGPCTL